MESRARHDETLLERLTFFSDAVFAIAMTLLVIEVRPPHLEHISDAALADELLKLLPNYIGFLTSFLVIGRFWVAHHTLFGMLKATSSRLIWFNLLLLLVVAFMPFPTAIFSEYVRLHVAVGFYSVWLILLGLVNLQLTRIAVKDRLLVRDDVGDEEIKAHRRAMIVPILIGAVAFVAGMISSLLTLAALAIATPAIGIAVRRWRIR